jgi:hypothetical protein
MAISAGQIATFLAAADAAPNNAVKGQRFEDLVAYLFDEVPGCIVERDLRSKFKTEQIDIAVGNDRLANGLALLPSVILAECKDWDDPLDSKSVGYFLGICSNRRAETGVIFAASGLAGDASDKTYAHGAALGAAVRGTTCLVVVRDDLEALTSTDEFIDLLRRRYLRAVASGAVGAPDP